MSRNTTVGQLLINESLPEDLRDYNRVLDKKSIRKLMADVADKHPEQYAEILQNLMDASRSIASAGDVSVSLRHLQTGENTRKIVQQLRAENQQDINDDNLTDDQREKRIVSRTAKVYDRLVDATTKEHLEKKSPYALQAKSGARGNVGQLASLVGADLLVLDHKGDPAPMPIYSSYSEGLDPVEYWAASYGTRKGLVDVKFATGDSGFLGKQLALAAQRQMVNAERPPERRLPVGLPADINDPDNEGAVLAMETAGYPVGTTLTPRVLEDIRRKHKGDQILIHSPMTSYSEDGGVDQWSAGMREKGRLSDIGDNIGIVAAQAISEPLNQGALDSKHRAGAGKQRITRQGFQYINNLLQAPETFAEAGPLSPVTGTVNGVDKAPQGGHYVTIGDERIYIRPGLDVTVKPGQKLEQGDDLTDGVAHPADLVRYKGVGEARRIYLDNLMEGLRNSNVPVHRRNAEALVASVINHAQVTDPDGYNDHLVDQVVPFNVLAHNYHARESAKRVGLKQAAGGYLEEPVLHYTPGTRITPAMVQQLNKFGIKDVEVNSEPPPFQPKFERLMTSTSHDPDWQTRLGGFYIGRSLRKSVHEGATSDRRSTSFLPALAQSTTMGQEKEQAGRY